jgi:hypothetical protein
MPICAKALTMAILCCSALLALDAQAEGIDTEHIFGLMIGSDVGTVGEREFQTQTTGRFSKADGKYRALGQEFELELVPVSNFRIELGSTFSAHDINGVSGFSNVSRLAWQGVSVDLRYKFMDRDTSPFGMTLALETHADRIDDVTAAAARNYGTEVTLAFDRELVPGLSVAALNLFYQPEWTRFPALGQAEQESMIGAAAGIMAQMRPGFLVGGEVRYMRKYEGIGLEEFVGQALYVGPTAYFQLSERSRLTATWSFQVWGRSAGSAAANFERHQARLVFGVNF